MTVQATSKEAFKKVEPTLNAKEELVYGCLVSYGSMTDKEMAYQIHMAAALVSARRGSLVKKGKVHFNGSRACKVSGMRAMTWRAITSN